MFRVTTAADETLLGELLYEITHWRESDAEERPPLAALMNDPLWERSVTGWGRPSDVAVVALDPHNQPAGAAWTRLVDAAHEVRVAVYPEFRARGVGRLLLGGLSAHAARAGITELHAAVERANPATAVFVRSGYSVVGESGTSVLLRVAP